MPRPPRNRAAQLADDNAALAAEVQALQNEVDLIVRPEYVAIQARAYGLGEPHEIPFTPRPVGPGAGRRRAGLVVGPARRAAPSGQTPLDSWLSLLFGPGG